MGINKSDINKFDINKFKIIKELGHGMNGVVFLVKYHDKKYALKIEHIYEKDIEKSNSSYIWREIFFCKKLGNKYPNQFTKLYKYDIISDCNYKHSKNIILNIKNKIDGLSQSKYCIRRIYDLVDGTFKDLIYKLSDEQISSFILQLSHTMMLLQKNGYSHGDIHFGNIGYIKTTKTYIKILNNKIPTYGYIYKLIDYGFIKNKNNNLYIGNRIKFELSYFCEYILIILLNIIYLTSKISIPNIMKLIRKYL